MKLYEIWNGAAIELPEDIPVKTHRGGKLELRWDAEVHDLNLRIIAQRDDWVMSISGEDRRMIGESGYIFGDLIIVEWGRNFSMRGTHRWKLELDKSVALDERSVPPKEEPSASAPALEKLREEEQQLTKAIANLMTTKKNLENENLELDKKNKELSEKNTQLAHLEAGIRDLRLEIQGMELEQSDKKKALAKIKEEIKKQDSELETTLARLTELKTRHMDAEKDLEDLKKLRSDKGMKDDEIAQATKELEDARQKLGELTAQTTKELEEAKLKLDEMTAQKNKAQADADDAQREMEAQEARRKELETKKNELENTNEELQKLSDEQLMDIQERMKELYDAIGCTERTKLSIDTNIRVLTEAMKDEKIAARVRSVETINDEMKGLLDKTKELYEMVFKAVEDRIVADTGL